VARTHSSYSMASQAPMLQRVWQSMRCMRRFTAADLQATAEAGETGVAKFVKALHQAGFLRLVQARVNGRAGSRDLWALCRDSGPLAPIRRADGSGVFDPNTQLTYGAQGQVLANASAPAAAKLSQAQREALRLLLREGVTRSSFAALRDLARAGLVELTVHLTPAGRALAEGFAATPAPHSQREGASATHSLGVSHA
jgi:hypothetical protein